MNTPTSSVTRSPDALESKAISVLDDALGFQYTNEILEQHPKVAEVAVSVYRPRERDASRYIVRLFDAYGHKLGQGESRSSLARAVALARENLV